MCHMSQVAQTPHLTLPCILAFQRRAGDTTLMLGMASSQALFWLQHFPGAHDVFGLFSGVPKR